MSEKTIHDINDSSLKQIKKVFDDNFNKFDEVGSSFCVNYNGQTIVDLKAGFINIDSEVKWSDKTLVNVWSTTKGIVAGQYEETRWSSNTPQVSTSRCLQDVGWPSLILSRQVRLTQPTP